MNQSHDISIPEALLYVNQAQKAKQSGDSVQYALALKGLQLEAERFEQKKRQDAFNNAVKLAETQSELTKEMRVQALDDEIKKSYEAGDTERADFLMALKQGGQRPAMLQELDEYDRRVERGITEDEKQLFGIKSADDPTTKERDIKMLDSLIEDGVIDEADKKDIIMSLFGVDEPSISATQEKLLGVHDMYKADEITESESIEMRKRILAGTESRSDTKDSIDALDIFPVDDPTSSALNKINLSFPKAQAERMIAYIAKLTEGKPFNELPAAIKSAAAEEFKAAVEIKGVGGESVKKVMQARELLNQELPPLLNMMEDYEDRYGKGSLGFAIKMKDGVLSRVSGRPTNPELDAIFTATQDVIANILLIRSGASVTENERRLTEAMLPTATVPLNFSRARATALLNANKRAANTFYRNTINESYSNVILDDYYVDGLRAVSGLSEREINFAQNVIDVYRKDGKSNREIKRLMRSAKRSDGSPKFTESQIDMLMD